MLRKPPSPTDIPLRTVRRPQRRPPARETLLRARGRLKDTALSVAELAETGDLTRVAVILMGLEEVGGLLDAWLADLSRRRPATK